MGGVFDFLRKIAAEIQANPLYQAVTSYDAQRAYALIALVSASALCIWFAVRLLKRLHNDTRLPTLINQLKIPGRQPSRDEAIQRQKERRLEVSRRFTAQTTTRIARTAGLGVFIPFSSLLIVTAFGDWFFPAGPVLVERATGEPIRDPTAFQLALFATDLFLIGGFNDVFEVFEINLGQAAHASSNLVYAVLILAFRIVADLFVLTLVFYTGRTFWNWRLANKEAVSIAKRAHAADGD